MSGQSTIEWTNKTWNPTTGCTSDLPGLPLENIHWVIVGGESGPGSRPVLSAWVENVLAQCRRSNVPFFFKQWGGTFKKRNGRLLNGMEYNERPICRSHASGLLG